MERGSASRSGGVDHLAFQSGDIWAVDYYVWAESIIMGKGAICDMVVGKDMTERFLVRATKHAVEFSSGIGLLDLTGCEEFAVGSCSR